MNDNKTNRYTENYMINFVDAQGLVIENASLTESECLPVVNTQGRVLAQPLFSPVAIPPFNNSAMDGYAVNARDLLAAKTDNPIILELIGLTAAGEALEEVSNSQGKAWKIMTGAPVPAGFDCIIPVENTKLEGKQVICFSSPTPGAHIRRRGEDFVEDKQILDLGQVINANTIMACSALGIAQVEVYKKINIAVFSTGKELVNDPTQPLKPGQIRNSNKPFILNWLKKLPVNAYDAGTNYDEVEAFENELRSELDKGTQIIISSGAVSMGDFDFIPQTVKKLGGEIIFHKSKIRPGKPILFAKFANGSLYFGLPGNPISAVIGLRFFVSTAIRKILGMPQEKPLKAISQNALPKKSGFRSILKATGRMSPQAHLEVSILEGQESFKIQPLLHANGWIVVAEDKNIIVKGDLVDFYPTSLYWE